MKSLLSVVNDLGDRISDAADKIQDRLVGKTVDVGARRVRLVRLLGEGGFGFVYLCRDAVSGAPLVLKRVTTQDPMLAASAKREIRVLETLPPHSNVITTHGSAVVQHGRGQGTEFLLLLELCQGGTLLELVEHRAGPLPERQLLDYFCQVCQAVAHLHAQSPPVAHRDIKLENILIHDDGRLKLIDFGSCSTNHRAYHNRAEVDDAEELIQRTTTLMYRAPEMVDLYKGQVVSEKVDIWALGCLVYALAFGVHPFQDGTSLQILNAKYTIPERHPYSPGVVQLIQQLLTVDPDERPTVVEVIEAIMAVERGGQVKARSRAKSGGKAKAQPVAKPAAKPQPDPNTFDPFADLTKRPSAGAPSGPSMIRGPSPPPAEPAVDLLGGAATAPAAGAAGPAVDFFGGSAAPAAGAADPFASASTGAAGAGAADPMDFFASAPNAAAAPVPFSSAPPAAATPDPFASAPPAAGGPAVDLFASIPTHRRTPSADPFESAPAASDLLASVPTHRRTPSADPFEAAPAAIAPARRTPSADPFAALPVSPPSRPASGAGDPFAAAPGTWTTFSGAGAGPGPGAGTGAGLLSPARGPPRSPSPSTGAPSPRAPVSPVPPSWAKFEGL